MAVLVTGASGFVGSWLVRRLIEQKETVYVLHRTNSSLDDLQGLSFKSCIGDITDLSSLQKAVQDVDTVFHLAGVVGYTRSQRGQMERVNVHGTQNVVDAIKKTGKKLVYMSSVDSLRRGGCRTR
jgi:dihydroflavonol-4-reductase